MKLSSLLLTGMLAAAVVTAAPVYLNTTTDTGGTAFFSTGPYTQIGDQITLAGTERVGNTATVQFFNGGGTGTFDATLRFFAVGAPVGSQFGSAFTVTGNSILSNDVLNVVFNLGGLVLPDNLIFTLSVANIGGASPDLGLTLFEPPTVGSSSNQFYITSNGSTFAQTSQGNSQDNLYFSLDASASAGVPEPGTMMLTLLAVPGLLVLRRARRQA